MMPFTLFDADCVCLSRKLCAYKLTSNGSADGRAFHREISSRIIVAADRG